MNILVLMTAMLVVLSAHNHYTCIFDKTNRDVREQSKKAKPDISSVAPSSNSRMLLTITRNPIRITLDYSHFNTIIAGVNGASTTTSTNLAFVLKALQVSLSFYMGRLQVYPLTTISAPTVCFDYDTPPNDQEYGISASDLHIYATYISDKATSYGATGKSCKYFGDGVATLPDATLQIGRPTMGRIKFNTYSLVDTQSSLTNRLFQSVTSTASHEVLHILGMDSTLYGTWLDSDQASANYSNVYASTTLAANSSVISSSRPTNTLFLTTPNVKAWTRTFFNCSSAPGMLLENQDGSGDGGGSHWQRVAMYDEVMTGTAFGAVKYFSALTFSALRDMGWYTVDATFNETSNYGYQKGCDFFYNACYGSSSYSEFCNAATQSTTSVCQSNFFGKAICSSQSSLMADGCGLYGPYFNCVDPASQNDGYQSYTREIYSTNSFCVKSTLGSVALPSTVQSRCYSYVCNSNNIVFTIGTNTITCLSTQAGTQKTISAFTGYLQCPIFSDFCTNSRKTCPNWCSQNGYCMGGVCNCISGYYGNDCSKTTCTTGLFYNVLTSTCVSTCPSGYFANTYNTACDKCSGCQQCFGEPTICTGCISSATNPQYYYNNTCSSKCPAGTFASGFNCIICDSAVTYCATCDVIATNCTSCTSGRYLSQPGYGTCQLSCPTTGANSVSDTVNFICVSTCSSNLVLVNTGSNINTCQYCPNSTFKLTSNSSCVTSCPNFFYANTTIWLCSQCDSSCLTCIGGYSQNCTSCSPTATLRYLLLKMCWSVCPGGYYSNDTAGACQICPVNLYCGNCTFLNSSQSIICTSCAYGYFLQSSTKICQAACNSSQFANLGNNSCVGCATSCLTCIGPDSTSCASCLSPLLYVSNVTGGFCISACPSVGFFNSGSTTCVACDLTCLNCSGSGASQCTACFNGSYLNAGYCRLVCPPAKYPNTIASNCSSCDGSCTYCFGPTIDNCTGCMSGMVLFNFTCTLTCPAGYTVNQWNVCFQHMGKITFTLVFLLAVAIF